MNVADDDSAAGVFFEYITQISTAEEARRASLEARGAAVITSSGTLVTLLFALSALATKQTDFVLADGPRAVLSFGIIAFVISALLALGTYVPKRTQLTDPEKFAEQLPVLWAQDKDFARKKVGASRLDQLREAQHVNDVKARFLISAISLEIVGVLLVGISGLMIL